MATPKQGARRPGAHLVDRGRDTGAPPREHQERTGDEEAEPAARPPRNYMLALILALIVFVILISVRVLWDGMEPRRAPPGALVPEQTTPATPAPSN